MQFSILLLILLTGTTNADDDQDHIDTLKDFVHDHPHLHELVDKTHQGDADAKHEFEKQSLSARFNVTKKGLPEGTDEAHVVLHFLDDYTHRVSGRNDHQFMALEPFLDMLNAEDDLKKTLIDLGEKLERAECDFTCLGNHLTGFLNEAMQRMSGHTEL